MENNFLVNLDIKNSEIMKTSRRQRKINVKVRCTGVSYWRGCSHWRNRRKVKECCFWPVQGCLTSPVSTRV
jgi:hypothetical protein